MDRADFPAEAERAQASRPAARKPAVFGQHRTAEEGMHEQAEKGRASGDLSSYRTVKGGDVELVFRPEQPLLICEHISEPGEWPSLDILGLANQVIGVPVI